MSYGRSGTGYLGSHLREDPGDRYILIHRVFFWLGMGLVTLGTALMIWGLLDTPAAATTTLGAAEEKCEAFSQVREWLGTAADVTGLLSFFTGWQFGRRAHRDDFDADRRP
ncbi:hypothetical protein [Streptomyces sp. A1547]|uniref:hypothetical protein n=1 Tax=Streptomyces sp. A1547 TaxID=2563105 RepID=UPI00144ADDCF|nr:hypothetical protein [Streptomyces sp. A1547]